MNNPYPYIVEHRNIHGAWIAWYDASSEKEALEKLEQLMTSDAKSYVVDPARYRIVKVERSVRMVDKLFQAIVDKCKTHSG